MKLKSILTLTLLMISIFLIGAMNFNDTVLTVYMVGDSTMAPYDTANGNQQRGWGQMFQQFFNDQVYVDDRARGGRSSKSFIDEGLWQGVLDNLQSGDYVFIQFAHNDEKTDDLTRGTDPWTTFYANLQKYVQETRDKGAIPILCTPIVRRYFDSEGHITETGMHNLGAAGDSTLDYAAAMRGVAEDMTVPLVELTLQTKELVESYGPVNSADLYISTDDTHPNILGATLIAQMAAQDIKDLGLDLANYLNLSSNLVANPLSISFGEGFINQNSQEESFSVSGFNLSPESGNLTISAPDGFQVSVNRESGYSQSIDIAYTNGTVSTKTIFARFLPTEEKEYSGYVNISTTGGDQQDVAVDGTGLAVSSAGSDGSVTWSLTEDEKVSAVAGPLLATDETMAGMEINRYQIIDDKLCQFTTIVGGAWTTETQFNPERWVQFSVSPMENATFYVDSISLYYGGKGGSGMHVAIAYSKDSTFAEYSMLNDDVGSAKDVVQLLEYSPAVKVDYGERLYLRVFPFYEANGTGKYLLLQTVAIGGSVETKEETFTALWPYETDDNPVSEGGVICENSYSPSMALYNLTDLPDQDANTHHVGSIYTLSKLWNAEPDPSDSLYFQYKVSPATGGTLSIKNISMYLGGWFTSEMKASVFYSKDSTFTEKATLIPDTLLPGNAIDKYEASLDESIASEESFYLRVYPHNLSAVGWAKLVVVDSLKITGTSAGVVGDPAAVVTVSPSYISTTTAKSGGNISSDGGTAVTQKGICWALTPDPTISDSKTNDGSGVGLFASNLTELQPGTTYYVRAYAINQVGVAYGNLDSLTTLDSLSVPTLVTVEPTEILVSTATSGGNITGWGGTEVTARGVCWNTTGDPTTEDSKTEDGDDIGIFRSALTGLAETATYFVRAYAINSTGTGYGESFQFTTQSAMPDVHKVVAKDGSGDYATVQAAFDDVPDNYTGRWIIKVMKGTYYEKLLLDRNKRNVILAGEDRDETILVYDNYIGKKLGDGSTVSSGSECSSVQIDAPDFTAMDITFENTATEAQAVALCANGDRQSYYRCNMLGFQDTYYLWGARATDRIYNKNCHIRGSVDFIYGRSIAIFDSCIIHENRNKGTLTAASTETYASYGLNFINCEIIADSIGYDGEAITSFYLGRPWHEAPRTVFINCSEPSSLSPDGWLAWNVTPGLYAEYNCSGDTTGRVKWSDQLTEEEAAEYTIENIFSRNSVSPAYDANWIPKEPSIIVGVKNSKETDVIPAEYKLNQNYPNPFNPTTTIKFALPTNGLVTIKIYNALGQEVATLINNEERTAGYHTAIWNGRNSSGLSVSSGLYIYRMVSGDFVETRKMMLLK